MSVTSVRIEVVDGLPVIRPDAEAVTAGQGGRSRHQDRQAESDNHGQHLPAHDRPLPDSRFHPTRAAGFIRAPLYISKSRFALSMRACGTAANPVGARPPASTAARRWGTSADTMSAAPIARPRLAAFVALCALAIPAAAAAESFSELIKRGFEQLQSRRFEEAAESLGGALEAEPASEPARKGLAAAWAAIGASHLEAGRLRQSRAALEKAVETRPESAEYHLLLAQALFREGDLRAARRETDLALELAPDSAPARELSGNIYNRQGLLNLAAGEWESAAQAGGSHALAEKLRRVRRDMAAEAGMERQTSRFFAIQHDSDVPAALVQGFFKLLDEAFNTLHDRLGEYPREEIPVVLYSQVTFRDVTLAPDWSGGLFDGRVIRIPVGGLSSVEEAAGLLGILNHEMTHAFLYRMASKGCRSGSARGWRPRSRGGTRRRSARGSPNTRPRVLRRSRTSTARCGDGGGTRWPATSRPGWPSPTWRRRAASTRCGASSAGSATGTIEEVFREEARMSLAEFQDRWIRGLR